MDSGGHYSDHELDAEKSILHPEQDQAGVTFERLIPRPENTSGNSTLNIPPQIGDEGTSHMQRAGTANKEHTFQYSRSAEGQRTSTLSISHSSSFRFPPEIAETATLIGLQQRSTGIALQNRNLVTSETETSQLTTNLPALKNQVETLWQSWHSHQQRHGGPIPAHQVAAASFTREETDTTVAMPSEKSDSRNEAVFGSADGRNFVRGIDTMKTMLNIPTGEELVADESLFESNPAVAQHFDRLKPPPKSSSYVEGGSMKNDSERKTAFPLNIIHQAPGLEMSLIATNNPPSSGTVVAGAPFVYNTRKKSPVAQLEANNTISSAENATPSDGTGDANVPFISSATTMEKCGAMAVAAYNCSLSRGPDPTSSNDASVASWLILGPELQASHSRLREFMANSRASQEALQDWDVQQGLPRSHSWTMMHTSRSRRQLEENRILPKWDGSPLIDETGITFDSKKRKKSNKLKQDSASN